MIPTAPVSIVIPCFNYGRFLSECLASIANQTVKPLETLIINDGSTDPETLKIFQNIARSGLRIIDQNNRGLGGARNTGIRNSNGKYIYFLDADDVMFPECLEILVSLMEQDEDAVAACSGMRFRGGRDDGKDWLPTYDPYRILVENLWPASILLRKQAAEVYGLWYDDTMRCHGYEDWDLNIRLTKTKRPIKVIREPLYHYRVHGKSLLTESRHHHAEILTYFRQKHNDLFAPSNLLEVKRRHAPGLVIHSHLEDEAHIRAWLRTQTFSDWTVATHNDNFEHAYHFVHSGTSALQQLPPEAIECAMMALESSYSENGCIIALRPSTLASASGRSEQLKSCQPIAFITRSREQTAGVSTMNQLNISNHVLPCNEQRLGLGLAKFSLLNANGLNFVDSLALRKRLSLGIRRVFGPSIQAFCVRLYDRLYYNILFSDSAITLRQKLAGLLGADTERIGSKLIYGLFLADSQSISDVFSRHASVSKETYPAPLFIRPVNTQTQKTNLLIATAWLNEGGVEQEILDLCRHLDQTRFQTTIVTTRRSSHPWEDLARQSGANVYHLADFLTRLTIPYGLAHLLLNLNTDVFHIVHSSVAYEAVRTIKRFLPHLSISDRNVTRGANFPKISATIGGTYLDVRTVGHKKLADYMSREFGLASEVIPVIYAGTDSKQVSRILTQQKGQLQRICNVPLGTPMVIFIGRMSVEKRPDIFVESVARIFEISPECNARFAMLGDGEMRGSIETIVRKLRLESRIHLLGSRCDAKDLLADATLMMMTSAYEGLALVSYEAMALGVPQIFADVGGQRELITPETGILVKNGPGEITRYARACLELLSDPERRARMAAAGKDRIKNYFSAENAVKQYAEIFEQMAALSRKRAAEIPHLRPPHINPLHELY